MSADPFVTDDAPVAATWRLRCTGPAATTKGRSPDGTGPFGHSDPQPVGPVASLPAMGHSIR